MKKRIALAFTFFLLTTVELLAQPGLPGDPSQAPLDGGLILLAAAGGTYAIKKLKGQNHSNIEH